MNVSEEKVDKLLIYAEIKKMASQGLSGRRIAKTLGLSRNTVSKYLSKDSEEMTTWLASTKTRTQKLDAYHGLLVKWIQKYPDISASQIHDWLEERGIEDISESSVRRYVRFLREDLRIPKASVVRQYEAVPDPEPGFQAQLDFGEKWISTAEGGKIKLYVIAFVLSHSRYKYMEWLDRHYTAEDLIRAHENAFRYFGGKPKEIVYDQDNVIIISENGGDIIYTSKFDAYRQTEPFDVYACRGWDPETKGRIENTIGFIKNNFADHRIFHDLEHWNEDALKWLVRKGNGKQHNTTKKVPAKVFEMEQQHLLPDKSRRYEEAERTEAARRIVRKDNTILYKANRYSVPLGTYNSLGTEVEIYVTQTSLHIVTVDTGELIAKHEISTDRGTLIQDRRHVRDRRLGIKSMADQVIACFEDETLARHFVEQLDERYPRYQRDQYQMLLNFSQSHDKDKMTQTLEYCIGMELFSANEFKNAHEYLHVTPIPTQDSKEMDIPLSAEAQRKLALVQLEKRTLETYQRMMTGGQ